MHDSEMILDLQEMPTATSDCEALLYPNLVFKMSDDSTNNPTNPCPSPFNTPTGVNLSCDRGGEGVTTLVILASGQWTSTSSVWFLPTQSTRRQCFSFHCSF